MPSPPRSAAAAIRCCCSSSADAAAAASSRSRSRTEARAAPSRSRRRTSVRRRFAFLVAGGAGPSTQVKQTPGFRRATLRAIAGDRKSGGEGKGGSGRVYLGGRRIIKKKKKDKT